MLLPKIIVSLARAHVFFPHLPTVPNSRTMIKVMKNNLIELVTNANIRATCKSEE